MKRKRSSSSVVPSTNAHDGGEEEEGDESVSSSLIERAKRMRRESTNRIPMKVMLFEGEELTNEEVVICSLHHPGSKEVVRFLFKGNRMYEIQKLNPEGFLLYFQFLFLIFSFLFFSFNFKTFLIFILFKKGGLGCWFIGEGTSSDGSTLIVSSFDPIYMLVEILSRPENRQQYKPIDDILTEVATHVTFPLSFCLKQS
jgi:hypothetical protein